MPTLTSNLLYSKPLVNNATDADLWGGQLNTNWDDLDTDIAHTTSAESADFNILATEFNFTYLINASGGTRTGTLPSSIPFNGFVVWFKAVDVSNTVTIDGNGNNIDGAATVTIDIVDDVTGIVSDATEWHIITPTKVDFATDAEVTSETAGKIPDASQLTFNEGVAKAWASFDDTGAVQDSYNVTSVTRTATGNYDIVLANTMANNDYSVTATIMATSGNDTNLNIVMENGSQTTTAFTLLTGNAGGSVFDVAKIFFTVHGTLA